MVLKEKTPDLLALLTAHVGGNAPVVLVVSRPSTLAPPHPSASKVAKKKRKRGKPFGKDGSEEGEIPPTTQQPRSKEPRIMRAQQKKGPFEGAKKSAKREQRTKATIWNPAFVLSTSDPLTFETTLTDAQKGQFELVFECLEQAMLLPRDMQELKDMRKREVFVSLKRDLAKICSLH